MAAMQVTPQAGGGDPNVTVLPAESMPPAEDMVGAPTTPTAPPEGDKVGQPIPERGVVAKTWTHFLGTDVQDPQQWTRLASIIAGSLAGGAGGTAAGAAVTAPVGGIGAIPGGIVGSVGGGLLGAIYPEAAMEVAQKLGIVEPGYRSKHGLTNDELKTYLEGEALLDVATAGGVAAARLGGRTIGRVMAGVGREGTQTAEAAARMGIDLLPVQVGEGRIARMYVNVLGRFSFMAPGVASGVKETTARYQQALKDLPARIAPVAATSDLALDILTQAKTIITAADKQWQTAERDILSRATAAGMVVDPKMTITKGEDILQRLSAKQGSSAKGQAPVDMGEDFNAVKGFIEKTVAPMYGAPAANGNRAIAAQNIEAMDTAINLVGKKMLDLRKNGSTEAADMLQELQTTMLTDLHQNSRGKWGTGAAGTKQAKDIVAEWDANSKLMSDTVATISDTVASNRLKKINTPGFSWASLNGTGPNTAKVPLSSVVDVLLKDEGPQVVEELSRITKPDTFGQFAAEAIKRRIADTLTTKDGVKSIDMTAFRNNLGLNDVKSQRYLQTKALLDNTPGGFDMRDLEEMAKIGDAVTSVAAPDVSAFAARRAVLSGNVLNAAGLGAILAHAGPGPIAGLAIVVGGRTFSKMITNPATSRLLGRAVGPDVSLYMQRQIGFRALQLIVREREEYTPEEAKQLVDQTEKYWNDLESTARNKLRGQ